MRHLEMIIVAALMAGASMAQQGDRAADLQAQLWRLQISQRVTLTARVISRAAKVGQPVLVELTIKNVSNGPVGYGEEMGGVERSFGLTVFREDGTAAPRVPPKGGIFGERGAGCVGHSTPARRPRPRLRKQGLRPDAQRQVLCSICACDFGAAGVPNELAVSDVVTFVISE